VPLPYQRGINAARRGALFARTRRIMYGTHARAPYILSYAPRVSNRKTARSVWQYVAGGNGIGENMKSAWRSVSGKRHGVSGSGGVMAYQPREMA